MLSNSVCCHINSISTSVRYLVQSLNNCLVLPGSDHVSVIASDCKIHVFFLISLHFLAAVILVLGRLRPALTASVFACVCVRLYSFIM